MSDIGYGRCENDDWKAASAEVGRNPATGEALELNVHGVSAALSIHAALVSLTAAMKVGHEEDFLEKIALLLLPRVQGDPHALCPMLEVMRALLLMMVGEAGVSFSDEGRVQIMVEDEEPGDEQSDGQCLFNKENNDGTDEAMGDEDEGMGDGGGTESPGEDGLGFSPSC